MPLDIQDPNSFCRICLVSKDSIMPFRSDLHVKIENCFSIKILTTNNLPNKICKECNDLVNSSHHLKIMIDHSENVLNSLLNDLNENKAIKLEFSNESSLTNLELFESSENELLDDTKFDINLEFEKNESFLNEDNSIEDSKNDFVDLINETQVDKIFLKKNLESFPQSFNEISNDKENKNTCDVESSLECTICKKVLSSKTSLKLHMKVHARVRQVECNHCGVVYPTLNVLKFHMKRIHKISTLDNDIETNKEQIQNNLFKCKLCKKEYTLKTDLDRHMQYGSGHLKCKYCGKIYVTKYYLGKHELNHEKNDSLTHDQIENPKEIFKCDICERTFDKQKKLTLHKNKSHTKDAVELKCQFCDLVYIKGSYLKFHQEKEHKSELEADNKLSKISGVEQKLGKKYFCKECNQNLSLSTFYKHFKTHGTTSKVKCSQCDKVLKAYNLQEHIKRIHGEKKSCEICNKLVWNYEHHKKLHIPNNLFKCTECGKTFNRRIQLNSHLKNVHYDSNKSICQICGKIISGLNNYKLHLGTHIDEKKISCDQCERSYATIELLKQHKRAHFREKIFKCTKCPKKFQTKTYLKYHFQFRHENYRPYKCEYCPKKFFNKPSLVQHTNSHMGRRPYVCQYCNNNFSFSGALYTHIKLKHKKTSGNIKEFQNN